MKTVRIAAALFLLYASETHAATQGSLGSPSTGTMNVGVIKAARADITSLADLSRGAWSVGDGDIVLTNDVCVYSTRPSGGYTIQPSGSGSGGAFTLANGAHTLAYAVTWNAGGVGALSNSGASLSPNGISGPLTHAATDNSTCNGTTPGPTARLIVTVTAAAMTAAPAGTYTGTLTLLVTPN